ncbi:MAG: homoserine dehydrogenase [Lachnospiraceae bacterium]|nr:homoserine dehydrogenase [Lachnospiraceae bacterium]
MNVAILGYGTVGSGVYEVLHMNHSYIAKCAGDELNVKYVLDLRDFPGQPVEKVLTHDFNDILNDPEVDIIAEVMGGENPAYEFTKKAILAGKAVCTSNKELVSKHGSELLALAKENKTNYFFEASVGGGIPIIRPINRSLTADDILEIRSIINGTTNYILTRMKGEGLDFDEALKEAQDNGFAERNPAADIEGLDATRKTAILASLVNQTQVECDDIYTEGITKISAADIAYASRLKAKIKLISLIRRVDGKTYACVLPLMINKRCQLYNVDGVFNAVMVKGNAVGDLMFYGSGAGKLPTASAVVGDIVEAAKHRHINVVTIWEPEVLKLANIDELVYSYFVRVPAAQAEKAKEHMRIDAIVDAGIPGEFAFVTEPMNGTEFKTRSADLEVISRIRAELSGLTGQ